MNHDYKKKKIIYPLIQMRPTKKEEIVSWFKRQPFDLEISDHLGNCVTCWKKSDRKLMTIAKNNPEAFEPFIEIEKKYSSILSKKDGAKEGVVRKIFRGHKSCSDIIELSASYFVEWQEIKSSEQLELTGLDQGFGCEESCSGF